jgi:hypothetical protein
MNAKDHVTEPLVKGVADVGIYTITLNRPAKRNAVSDRLLAALEQAWDAQPTGTRVVVLCGAGDHFCAGLDLSEHQHRDPFGVMLHSQGWQRVFNRIETSGTPVAQPEPHSPRGSPEEGSGNGVTRILLIDKKKRRNRESVIDSGYASLSGQCAGP